MREVITTETREKPLHPGEMCGSVMPTWLYLVRVHDRMQHHLMDHLGSYDLTTAQYDVLAHLSAKPGISQQALAQELLVTKGNICGLIDRLSARGLVERRSDPEDRRLNLLYLTSDGEKLAKEAVPAYAEFVQEHMAGLTTEQLASMRDMLLVLDRTIHEH